MDPKAIDRIFWDAAQLASPAECDTYLDRACAGDAELRRHVERLLQARSKAESFLEAPAAALVATSGEEDAEGPGAVVGPYKLLEQIGEGGFGVVYMAEQQQPMRRKVALKVLKPGMDTRQVVARFEAERQALALMDHPNIARVFDGGTTASGRPYFVMELVKGAPVTEFCDQNRLSVRERLRLFGHVCQAVQHAHQKGVIHRDLKPSNVLVTLHDGVPVVKVIDFGIAKATGQPLTDKTLFTNFAQLVGTPLYMSPEQAALSGLDVDTRSDIYSLGVLLYELLTGTTPFAKDRFREAGYDEVRRIIREEEPPKPSTRLSTLGQAATTVSAQRQTDPKRLSQLCRGELDWVVMKCLEKDRDRRYEAANSLALDIQRYLRDEPVQACPPSAGYRIGKFVRRNKAMLLMAALVAVVLLAGTLVSAWQALRATQAGQQEAFQRQLAQREKVRAEDNLKKARTAVDKLLTGVATQLDKKPHMEKIRRRLLEDALEFYQEFLKQGGTDPEMRYETARAARRVGEIHEMLGNGPEGEAALREAITLLAKLVEDFPAVPAYRESLAFGRGALAFQLWWARRHEENVELRRAAVADWQKLAGDFGGVPRYRRLLAHAHTNLANALKSGLGRLPEAEHHYREALVVWNGPRADSAKEPDDLWVVAHSHLWLGVFLRDTERFSEAERELRRAVAASEQLVAEAPEDVGLRRGHVAQTVTYLAELLQRTGRATEAAQRYRQAVAIGEKLREDFPDYADVRRTLAQGYAGLGETLLASGRAQEAEAMHRRSLATCQKLAAEHRAGMEPYRSDLAKSYSRLGLLLYETDRPEDAARAIRQAGELFDRLARDFPDALGHQLDLAWFLATCPVAQFHDPDRAIAAAQRAAQRAPLVRGCWRVLGIAQYRAGKWQAAVEALTQAREADQGRDAEDGFFLAMAHWQLGDRQQARQWYDRTAVWVRQNHLTGKDLERFHAEAASLLGVDKK